MNPIKMYDYLTLARGRVLAWTRTLSAEQYGQMFPIGLGSLARTLTHTMVSESMYMRRIMGVPVPPRDQWTFHYDSPPPLPVLEEAWAEQAGTTRAGIAGVTDWGAELEYRVDWDGTPTIVTASRGDIFTQLVFHEVHHRAQAMNMLRQVGIAAEDLDYNAMMYKRRPAGE